MLLVFHDNDDDDSGNDDNDDEGDVNDDDDDDDNDDDDVNDDYLRLLTALPPAPSALSRQLRQCSDGKALSHYCCFSPLCSDGIVLHRIAS